MMRCDVLGLSWLSGFTFLIAAMAGTMDDARADDKRWTLVIHGGAGGSKDVSDERVELIQEGLQKSLEAGSKILAAGGTSMDAVEASVRVLEDNPLFNAGRGAVMTIAGTFELDASIMDGATLEAGGVAGVRYFANPISVARKVMEDKRSIMLSGEGAEQFAEDHGFTRVEPSYFFDQKRFDEIQRYRERRGLAPLENPALRESRGTVGAVALDQHGNLAAATSTGGRTGKLVGRVGDSPVIGAGTYAENGGGAISCTGIGEEFIRHSVAAQCVWRSKHLSLPLDTAVDHVLTKVLKPDDGGIIGVSPSGDVVMRFSTPVMNRGFAKSDGTMKAMVRGEESPR